MSYLHKQVYTNLLTLMKKKFFPFHNIQLAIVYIYRFSIKVPYQSLTLLNPLYLQ